MGSASLGSACFQPVQLRDRRIQHLQARMPTLQSMARLIEQASSTVMGGRLSYFVGGALVHAEIDGPLGRLVILFIYR